MLNLSNKEIKYKFHHRLFEIALIYTFYVYTRTYRIKLIIMLYPPRKNLINIFP